VPSLSVTQRGMFMVDRLEANNSSRPIGIDAQSLPDDSDSTPSQGRGAAEPEESNAVFAQLRS